LQPDEAVRVFNATTLLIRCGQPFRADDSQQYLAARHRIDNSLGEVSARLDRVCVDENAVCAKIINETLAQPEGEMPAVFRR
jgi:hypothetical protein